MQIGDLNRRISILEYKVERDEYGGEDGRWIVVGRVWAKIEPTTGVEFLQGQQVQAEQTTKITVRYYPALDVMHRVEYGGKVYEILAVADLITNHRWTVITAKEMVSDGLQRKAEKGQGECSGCECACEGLETDGRCSIIGFDEGC